MWQLSALASLVTTALEDVVDKAAIVHDRAVDTYIATFWRQALFLAIAAVVAYSGFFGVFQYAFGWQIWLYSLVTLPACVFYTVLLRRIEVTGIEAFSCLSPLLFLGIDLVLFSVPLTYMQIAGILLLTFGGFAFAIDGRTHRVKREFSWFVIGILVYSLLQDVAEFYLYKDMHTSTGLSGVSFYVSSYIIISLGALALVFYKRRGRLLFHKAALRYIPLITLSKSFDVVGGLLWLFALSRAAVSQVAAISALEPIVLFVVAFLFQKEMRIRLAEKLDHRNILWKGMAVILLCAGGWVVV